MDTLLLTSPADRHSHAFGSRKTACPGSIHLLVGKHNVGETKTTHQQAAGIKTKKWRAKCSLLAHYSNQWNTKNVKQATCVKIKKIASKMLTIYSLIGLSTFT